MGVQVINKANWYIDVKGDNGWMSGNIMEQGDCGYGGFYTFSEALELFYQLRNKKLKYTKKQIREYHSEGDETFVPQTIYIGYAPDEDDKDIEDNLLLLGAEIKPTGGK